jgi:hypothetical protein
MVGIPGISVYFVALLILGGLCFGAIERLRNKRGIGSLLLLLLMALVFILMASRGVQSCVYLYHLHHLNAQAIENMDVNGRVLANAADRSIILAAFKDAQWFEPSHSGWSRPVPLSLRLEDGKQYNYSIALYKDGAVILGRSGSAFSRTALLRIGIKLSTETKLVYCRAKLMNPKIEGGGGYPHFQPPSDLMPALVPGSVNDL